MSSASDRLLANWPVGPATTIADLQAPAHSPEWLIHLRDLGFVPGEAVRVLRRAALGGDPLVVRVGGSTYALRHAEAACVRLQAGAPGGHPHPAQ
jgi:ferrous iron transport protein A